MSPMVVFPHIEFMLTIKGTQIVNVLEFLKYFKKYVMTILFALLKG